VPTEHGTYPWLMRPPTGSNRGVGRRARGYPLLLAVDNAEPHTIDADEVYEVLSGSVR